MIKQKLRTAVGSKKKSEETIKNIMLGLIKQAVIENKKILTLQTLVMQ